MAKKRRWPWGPRDEPPEKMPTNDAGTMRAVMLPYMRMGRESQELGADVIYAAVTRIAGALATMPVTLCHGRTPATDDARHWLMRIRPNRRMSAAVFKRALMGWVLTEGRGYAVKRYDASGTLRELEIVDPRQVTPLVEEKTRELWYAVTREDGVIEYLHSMYILAFHHMTMDGITALRPVDILRGAIQYVGDIREFSLENVKNGISRVVVLEYPAELSGDRRKRSVAEFMALYRESGGQVLALDAGVRASRLDGSPIESGLRDVEQITRSRVATVYNLPPHLLGDYSDATAASIEQQTIEFITLTMQPIVAQWEEELDYKLLTPEEIAGGWHFHIDVEAYLRGDSAATATRDQAAIRTGKRTVNELRARDYLPPVEGGDVALVSKDLAPIDMVASGGTIAADAVSGALNAAKEGEEEDE